MKLADRTVEIHSAGIKAANQFSIAQTSKMFRILSDSLYSDKVMAVIRELSTNAYDAHIAAKNQNPFRVTLPTQTNPSFTVRDFGTGLSQSDMEELYTTYGASNKNDSNDFVGCLGLGSKSPFAYTKSFSTISYYGGKKLSYIAAMDESGVPSLNLVSVTDTKEPNGLEISFAVKQYDFHEFTAKAKRIFHYFKLKPIIDGGVCSSINDGSYSHHNVVIEGKGWKIGRVSNEHTKYPSSHNSPGSGVVAIMGNIAYPVDSSKIVGEDRPDQPDHIQKWNRAFGKADVDNWKSLVREILNAGLYLEIQFGIGELEMDVSRESLQYTKNVIKTLRDRTQEIYLELKRDMSDKLSTAKSLVEAYQTYYNLSDLAGGWTAGASWTDSNNKVHELQSGKDLEYTLKKSKNLYVFNFRTSGYRSRRMVYLTDKIHSETLNGKGQYYWQNNRKSNPMAFFVCDVKGEESAKKIVTKYCNQNDCYAYLFIDSDHPEDSSEGFEKIISDIGGEDKLLKVSDFKSLLSSPSKKGRTVDPLGSVSKDSLFLIHGKIKSAGAIVSDNLMNDAQYLLEIKDQEERDDVLEQDEIVYIPILRYASVEGFPGIHDLNKFIKEQDSTLATELFGNTKIFAIKSSYANDLIKKGYNLVSFNKFFKEKLEKLYENKFKDLAEYNGLTEHARSEYNKGSNDYNYYNYGSIDKQFMFHVLNLLGLEYGEYIKDKQLVSLMDQCMTLEFFADTIFRSSFDIQKFKAADYFVHITKLLHNVGLNGINSKDIRQNNILYNSLIRWVATLYGSSNEQESMTKLIKADYSLKDKLPKVDELRNSIKEVLDKQPMLKYIVCSQDCRGDLRELRSTNPLSFGSGNSYYSKKSSWSTKFDNVDKFKELIGNSII
jgi:hypothetical protein